MYHVHPLKGVGNPDRSDQVRLLVYSMSCTIPMHISRLIKTGSKHTWLHTEEVSKAPQSRFVAYNYCLHAIFSLYLM